MIAVISHDAGGAEILSSYVRQEGMECLFVLVGPARSIFERKLGRIATSTLDEVIRKSTSMICSTSWESDIEVQAIKLSRTLGKRSVAFLDHWVNYRERFTRCGEIVLPDEIWVGDHMAKAMATDVFLNVPIKLIENPYLKDIKREFNSIQTYSPSRSGSISVLYVCEPISTHALLRYGNAHHWGYVEDDALRYFLLNISALNKPVERVVIRPHPSEANDKYSWVQQEFKLPILLGGTCPLVEEIAESDVIVGCESMALVVALSIGKKVLSCIPPNGRTCVLPHTEIVKLQDLLEKKVEIYEDKA
jgi:hypothetical protein